MGRSFIKHGNNTKCIRSAVSIGEGKMPVERPKNK
jgi:hypothetical protein